MADIRYNNSFSLAGGFNITNAEPIDSRMYVADIQHIYSADNWVKVKPYPGLIVSAPSGEVRICVNADFTKEESWKKIGGGNVSVETFAEAEELAVEANIGQVIYVSGESVAYIVSGEGVLMKLATSTAGDIDSIVAALQAEVKALENVVGKEATDEAEATGLVKAVADNAAAIEALQGINHDAYIAADATLKEELQGEISQGLAGKADKQTYEDKVAELEGAIATAIEDAAQDAQDKADAAQEAAEGYADELNTAMNTRVAALEGINHDAYIAADATLKEELQGEIAKKVTAVEGSRLMTDAEGAKLEGIEAGAEVNVIKVVKVNGQALTVAAADRSVDVIVPTAPVQGVAEGDKIISLDGDKLKSTLTLAYVPATETEHAVLRLQGIDGTVVSSIDATAFVKDGMISDAKLDGPKGDETGEKYLSLTFNTDGGSEEIRLNVSDLIDYYAAGNGLNLDGKTFSVKVDETANSYLQVTTNGIAVSKAFIDKITELDNAVLDAAQEYVDNKVDGKFDTIGSAAKALEDAQADAAEKYQVKGNYETAGAAAKALEDAQADAAEKYQVKGNYETAGAAAKALEDAQAYVDEKVDGKFDTIGSAAKALEDAQADAAEKYVSKVGFNEYTEAMETKLNNIEDNAEVNVIEKVQINGIAASIDEDKVASVKVDAKDIELGIDITGSTKQEDGTFVTGTTFSGNTKISTVLQSIQDSIRAAVAGGVNSVTSSDNIVEVNNVDPNNPKVSIKVEASSETTIANGHIELVKGENGLYGVMYYEGDDNEIE